MYNIYMDIEARKYTMVEAFRSFRIGRASVSIAAYLAVFFSCGGKVTYLLQEFTAQFRNHALGYLVFIILFVASLVVLLGLTGMWYFAQAKAGAATGMILGFTYAFGFALAQMVDNTLRSIIGVPGYFPDIGLLDVWLPMMAFFSLLGLLSRAGSDPVVNHLKSQE